MAIHVCNKKMKTSKTCNFVAAVHCCRFSNWMPSPVTSLSCDPRNELLAVGRENGNIEIRKINESWRVERTIPGRADVPVLALGWYAENSKRDPSSIRLIGASMDGSLFEVDLRKLELKNVQDSFGGTIWSMAIAHKSGKVAIGCEDGVVRMFSLEDGDIHYSSALPTLQQRVLSLVWDDDKGMLYTGGSDGTIRFFDLLSGQSTTRLTLEQYGEDPTHVWCLTTLENGKLLASGDSLGQVKIWDVGTGTLLQQLNTHSADILCLASSPGDTELLFASGVDSKVVCIGPLTSSKESKRQEGDIHIHTQWTVLDTHRPHTHDVKALALCLKDTKKILVSGSVDTKLCVYSPEHFGQTRPKRIWPFPYQSIVSVATLPRKKGPVIHLVMVCHTQKLEIWQLAQTKGAALPDMVAMADGSPIPGYSQHELWGRVDLEGTLGWNLTCAALSPNGAFLAYSSPKGTELLRLDYDNTALSKVRKVPKLCSRPAHGLAFSPDGKWLIIAALNGELQVLSLLNPRKPSLEHVFDAEEPESPIAKLVFSSDGQWLACSYVCGSVYLFNMDTFQIYWKLPNFDSPPTALAFHWHNATLVVACASNMFYLFDVEERRLSEWSRDCGSAFPKELLHRPEPITGITFNPAKPSELVLYSHGFFCHVNLRIPVPKKAQIYPPRHVSFHGGKHPMPVSSEPSKKRMRKSDSESDAEKHNGSHDDNFVICLKYRPIIYLGFHGKDELVVLENPWLRIVSSLPDTLYRHRYGT